MCVKIYKTCKNTFINDVLVLERKLLVVTRVNPDRRVSES